MSYTVREAQDGEVTAEEDYIEPDRAGWDAAVSAAVSMHLYH